MDESSLAPVSTAATKSDLGIKLISLMLILGGTFGAVLFVIGISRLLDLLGVLVFVCTVRTGFDLWKKKPAGYKWARVLFAAQIPLVTVPGFFYAFYTGLGAWGAVLSTSLQSGGSFHGVTVYFHLGAELHMWFGGRTNGFVLGVNALAIGILIYLLKLKPPKAQPITTAISPAAPDTPPLPSVSPE